MRILHIGDYHYKSKANNYDQNLMVESMINNLKERGKIDLIIFSGDLVYSGKEYFLFEKAHISLLEKLSDSLSVPMENIIMAEGNHDINRDDCSVAIVNYFDNEVDSNEKLNSFYLANSNDLRSSMKPSNNYFNYLKTYFNKNEKDVVDELFTIHRRKFNNKEIGIVTLNTAWLSSGYRNDNGNLMLPDVILKNAIEKIKGTNCKIIILHHPLTYFKEFNSIVFENLIYKEFDLMFSGHIHREQITTKFAGTNGIFANTTQATLTFDKDGEIGYSLINYDFNEHDEIILDRGSFNKKENKFINNSPVFIHVPCGAEKASQNKLRRKITSKFYVELNVANELLLDYDEKLTKNFLEIFTPPVISRNNDTVAGNKESDGLLNYEILFNIDRNYLIFGNDKCGKTSLLKRVQLNLLKNYSLLGKVPFYLNYKELELKSRIDISNLLRNYYEITNNEASNIIKNGDLILLIDNLDTNSSINESIINFLENNRNVRFLMCSDYLASRIYFDELDHLDYEKYYFKELSRKEIRLYTENLPSVKESDKESAIERVTKFCKQLQLPVNYWTVSLILLIYKKSNDDYNKNLFGVLDLCVDEILQKKHLFISKNEVTFDQYKEICSKIAHFLLTKHKADIYSASSTQITNFISTLIEQNIRIVGDPIDIFQYLLDCGILKEKNGKYTFRLNGLFEYFLAYFIYHNSGFKEEILHDDRIYLGFKNELEIYSGFNRADEHFLKNIFNKTKGIFEPIFKVYKKGATLPIDDLLLQTIGDAFEYADSLKKMEITKPFTHSLQDAVQDEIDPLSTTSEVHLKEIIDSGNMSPENLEKFLNILARVFKNSDGIQNMQLVHTIFDFLLEAYSCFGFYMIDQYSKMVKRDLEGKKGEASNDFEIGEQLFRMMTTFIPVMTEVLLYNGIGHANTKNIIISKIKECKKDLKNNQYKLFMLYFLLLDIDIKGYKHFVDEIFETVTLSPLKVSTLFKLSYYLAFKAYKNKDMEEFFKNKIKIAQIRLDNKTDVDNMNKYLSKKVKSNMVRKKVRH